MRFSVSTSPGASRMPTNVSVLIPCSLKTVWVSVVSNVGFTLKSITTRDPRAYLNDDVAASNGGFNPQVRGPASVAACDFIALLDETANTVRDRRGELSLIRGIAEPVLFIFVRQES